MIAFTLIINEMRQISYHVYDGLCSGADNIANILMKQIYG